MTIILEILYFISLFTFKFGSDSKLMFIIPLILFSILGCLLYTSMLLINSLKDSFTKDKTIIMNGQTDNTKGAQLKVNSLEDKDNIIRLIFAVDMLNEGWDVLILFDIVRLYDTRQGGKGISTYTIREAPVSYTHLGR